MSGSDAESLCPSAPSTRAGVAMALKIVLDREAARCFERLDRGTQERVASKLDALAERPTAAGSKPLHGYPGRDARVGGLRLVHRLSPLWLCLSGATYATPRVATR